MSLKIRDKPCFTKMLMNCGTEIKRKEIKKVQVNIGKRCNQQCIHCHVDVVSDRTENMEEKTANRLLALLSKAPQVEKIDITGGAPELNSHFRTMVTMSRKMGKEVINRTNLTVFFEPGQEDTPQFLADNAVQIFASLPGYTEENVDKQRGKGTFEKSIRALHLLNKLGYGESGTNLILNLVYNPPGAFLPGEQSKLEADYKKQLKKEFDVDFNHLVTIINMPIGRFHDFLEKEKSLERYMSLLVDHFNPDIVDKVMCTEMISISWDGYIYDCDFNQMLEIPVGRRLTSLWDINRISELEGEIILDNHCYGCTAGEGSSCEGVLK